MKARLINQELLSQVEAQRKAGRSILEAVIPVAPPRCELECLSPAEAVRYLGQRKKLDESKAHEVELQHFALP